jgi:hypothetical protein
MMISAEFSRNDYSSIPYNCDRLGTENT